MPQKPRPRGKGDAQIHSIDLNVVVAAEVVAVVEVESVEIVEIGMVTVKIVVNVVVAVAEEIVADVGEVEDVVDSEVKTEEASVVKTGEASVVKTGEDSAVDLVVMQASLEILDLVVDLEVDLEVVVMISKLEDEAGDVVEEDLHVSDQTMTMHHPHLRILVDLENLTQVVSVEDLVVVLVELMVKREIDLLDEVDSVAAVEEEEEEDVGDHVNLTGEAVMTKVKNKDLDHLLKKQKKLLSKLKQKLL